MGYFSNGEEGERYERELCSRCAHYSHYLKTEECAVLDAHLIHNYDECNNKDSILHILIPIDKEGHNEKCRMFICL